MKNILLIIFLSLFAVSCSRQDKFESELFQHFRETPSPASVGSGQPFLFVTEDKRIFLSWVEPGENKKHTFRYAELENDRWSSPNTIIEGDNFFVNWADVPSIFQSKDGVLAAHWLQSSGEWVYAYDVRVKTSVDGGKSWSEDIIPHRDGTQTEHGFASFYNHPEGGIGIVWLDGREAEYSGAAGGSHGHGGDWNMHLRTAIITDDDVGPEILLDDKICECCPTAAVETNDGVLIAYRNRTDDEIRDIYLVRYENGKWTNPYPLHNDLWNIPGCPVNGPALSGRGNTVVASWYTAADNDARVFVAFSRDGGKTFNRPYRVNDEIPLGRTAVELLDDRSALVVWIELKDENAGLMVRRVYQDGVISAKEKIATITDDRSSGFPRMVRVGDMVLFAWVDTFDESIVRTAVAKIKNGSNN